MLTSDSIFSLGLMPEEKANMGSKYTFLMSNLKTLILTLLRTNSFHPNKSIYLQSELICHKWIHKMPLFVLILLAHLIFSSTPFPGQGRWSKTLVRSRTVLAEAFFCTLASREWLTLVTTQIVASPNGESKAMADAKPGPTFWNRQGNKMGPHTWQQ